MNTPIIDVLLGPGTALAFFGDPTKPYAPLSRTQLAGPTVRDLIDALRLLDPDTKTSITEVHSECEGDRRLVLDGFDNRDEFVADLERQIKELEKEVDGNDEEKSEIETSLEKAYSEIERLTEEIEALKGGQE